MQYCTRQELADIIGCTPRTITTWQAEGMPVAEVGGTGLSNRYHVPACVWWSIDRGVARDLRAGGQPTHVLERHEAKAEARQALFALSAELEWNGVLEGPAGEAVRARIHNVCDAFNT